jgi:hypothetical protein
MGPLGEAHLPPSGAEDQAVSVLPCLTALADTFRNWSAQPGMHACSRLAPKDQAVYVPPCLATLADTLSISEIVASRVGGKPV